MPLVLLLISNFATTPSTVTWDVVFHINVPTYFLQVRQVQNISVLTFLTGIVAFATGVIAAGTAIAFITSYILYHRGHVFKIDDGHNAAVNVNVESNEMKWQSPAIAMPDEKRCSPVIQFPLLSNWAIIDINANSLIFFFSIFLKTLLNTCIANKIKHQKAFVLNLKLLSLFL
jgi:hypothetical protein